MKKLSRDLLPISWLFFEKYKAPLEELTMKIKPNTSDKYIRDGGISEEDLWVVVDSTINKMEFMTATQRDRFIYYLEKFYINHKIQKEGL